jgi:hypothetical protein
MTHVSLLKATNGRMASSPRSEYLPAVACGLGLLATALIQYIGGSPYWAICVVAAILTLFVALYKFHHVKHQTPDTLPLHNDDSAGIQLRAAASAGNLLEVRELLKRRTPVDASDTTGMTALHLAAEAGHTSTVDELLKCGANIDARGPYNQRAVDFASRNGHADVIKLLRKRAAKKSLWDAFLMLLANP